MVSKLTNDISFIQSAVTAAMNSAISDSLSVLALVISMLYLDWKMTLVVLCVYPLAALPIALIAHRLRRVAKATQSQLGDMTSLLTEKLSGARLIKSFQLEDYAASKLSNSFEQVFRLRLKAVKTRARLDPLLEALGGLAVAGVVALAYLRISSGISTVGDFMGFVTALLMAAQPIKALGNLSGRVQEGLAAIESIYEVIDEKPAIIDRPGAKQVAVTDGAISFRQVGFGYDPATKARAVADFTLEVPGGKTVALVGRSGAGKSTIINLVPRLFDVTEGAILIDGQDVRDVTLASLRSQVSIVSQDITLFDDTIAANIALGKLGATEAEIRAAAEAAAAHDFIMAQPQGYATMIGDRGGRLIRRAEAAPRARPRHSEGRPDPAARRGDQRARHRERAPGAGGSGPLHPQQDDARHRPSHVHHPARRSHLRHGRRTYRRTRRPQRTHRQQGCLCAARGWSARLEPRQLMATPLRRAKRLFAMQDVVHKPVGQRIRVKRALDLVRIVNRLDPSPEPNRISRVVGEVALEKVVEHAGVGLADMSVLETEFLSRIPDRFANVHDAIESTHQAGTVRTGFAVDEHRIVNGLEKFLRVAQFLA